MVPCERLYLRVVSQKIEEAGRPQCAFVLLSDYGTRGGQVCWWSVLLPHRQCGSLKSSIVTDEEEGWQGPYRQKVFFGQTGQDMTL